MSQLPPSDRSGRRAIPRRLGNVLLTLLIIAFITQLGLMLADYGRRRMPVAPLQAAGEALWKTAAYVVQHPASYYWHHETIPAGKLVLEVFGNSAGLLLLSLGLAALVGVPLGISMALSRRRLTSLLALLISVLGISTPSFLLAMFLWVINLQIHNLLGTPSLPPNGFGWDAHVLMPVLVLAARPMAQVAQITYVSLSEILGQDYIRTAHGKGLPERLVRSRHALRNALVPILTTLGTSARLSLASLPIVEYFFVWPGLGLTLLQAIGQGSAEFVTDLIVCLGLLFLAINLGLEMIFPLLDPRLWKSGQRANAYSSQSWRETLQGLVDSLAGWWQGVRQRLAGRRSEERGPLVPAVARPPASPDEKPAAAVGHRALWRALRNPTLLVGFVLVLAFVALAVFGQRLTTASPYTVHGVMMIEGTIGAPPYKPSPTFPWGTDHIGRDIQALVLAGARQTLALALFGMLARVLVGGILGALAGWWQGGRLDRLVTGAAGVWAAFPVTIFAMLLIQAMGIQQGMWVFIVALCVVGWGEIAQLVRQQVIGIKPQLYIEAAHSVGSRPAQLLTRHVVPNLLPSLLVLAILEMGGILMLLAELGFLNIFVGGGFRAEISDTQIVYYSDVPEWAAMLANIRAWWRSYPWFAWYPGVAFFLSIMAFNLWGEGLRRFIEESRVNVSRLFSRYTVMAGIGVVVALVLVLRSTTPLGLYRAQARTFDAERAMEDIQYLATPQLAGREIGTVGVYRAAQYIADRMEEIGLIPVGDKGTYIQTMGCKPIHVMGVPLMEILDAQGEVAETPAYRKAYVEYGGAAPMYGKGEGALVGVVAGPDPQKPGSDAYGLGQYDLRDKVLIVLEEQAGRLNLAIGAGALIVTEDPLTLQRRQPFYNLVAHRTTPAMYITPELADHLLASAGSSLAAFKALEAGLAVGEVALTDAGTVVRLDTSTQAYAQPNDACYNVLGIIPGTGAAMGERMGAGLDSQVIIVSAYYDGLGRGPDGTLYPGANDNASGVATMLEIARALKDGPYQPKKTVFFVAWTGGERGAGLSVKNVMNAQVGFSSLTVEAVLELAGVGAGTGEAIALERGSSFRLAQLIEKAAGRLGTSITTRGSGVHHDVASRAGFGGRSALSAYISWDGADATAHLPGDTPATIDAEKLRDVGQTTLLTLMVLSREVDY